MTTLNALDGVNPDHACPTCHRCLLIDSDCNCEHGCFCFVGHGGTNAYCPQCGDHMWKDQDGEFCLRCQPSPDDEAELNLPYPFCMGNPTKADCHNVGYCRREYACND